VTMLWALALTLGCVAGVEDLRRNHIPNWINAGTLVAALLLAEFTAGWAGLALAAAGAAAGFGVFLVFYWAGALGGGDIKLMAAFGGLLGPSGILVAALLAAVIGALLAAASLAWNRHRRVIPYAPAIVLGAWLALLGKG
jgi:prepilin peptidase CpaA